MEIGEKIHTIGKVFNVVHAGFTREDAYPPSRMMQEPVRSGEFKREVLSINQWDNMLDQYYEIHGWDKKTSWPTPETLRALDLEELIDMVENARRRLDGQ